MKLLLLAGVICMGGAEVGCILSKGGEGEEAKASDSAAEQSIKRDYSYEEGYGHGGYGLSAHYGFPEGHEGFGALEGGKQYVHYPEEQHHQAEHHKHYDVGYHKALAIKSLLVPLAGVALLGAAAAFVSNPILLQLGVISGSSLGRRKRETAAGAERLQDLRLLGRFVGQIPEGQVRSQGRRMVANYLSCSGLTGNLCLERLACELHSAEGARMAAEASVLAMALGEILDNEFVPEDTKSRLRKAIDSGRKSSSCGVFRCREVDAEGASL